MIFQPIYENSLNFGGDIEPSAEDFFAHGLFYIYVSVIDGIVAHEPNHSHGRDTKQWTSGWDSGRLYTRADGNEQSLQSVEESDGKYASAKN